MKQRIALWLAFCAALGVAVFACVPRLFLTAEDETGKIVFLRPVYEGDRYAVRFIHSVARRPVDEIYEIAPDASVLRETVYDMTGAGLPTVRHRKVTTCARVQPAFGEKAVAEVPVVISLSRAQRTASA